MKVKVVPPASDTFSEPVADGVAAALDEEPVTTFAPENAICVPFAAIP